MGAGNSTELLCSCTDTDGKLGAAGATARPHSAAERSLAQQSCLGRAEHRSGPSTHSHDCGWSCCVVG